MKKLNLWGEPKENMVPFRKSLKYICIILPLFCFGQVDYGDEYPENSFQEYEDRELNHPQGLEESGWLDKASAIDYSENKLEKTEEKKEPEAVEHSNTDWSWLAKWWAGIGIVAKIFCIVLLVALVVFIIFRLSRLEGNSSFSTEKSLEERLKEIEENLEESELEKLLREAINGGDYKLAIRLYFLLMLQKLSEKQWINYKKQKTNFLYLLEMRNRSEYLRFRELTHAFEFTWYGDVNLDQNLFSKVEKSFKQFLKELAN